MRIRTALPRITKPINALVRVVLITLALASSAQLLAIEEPAHTVVEKEGNIEVRLYAPTLVAEVVVSGDMRRAGRKGFRSLADFIFGNNKPAEKIEMTAPVSRSKAPPKVKVKTTKIDMTTPVTRTENGDDSWVVRFVMPEKWTKDTLPQPVNPEVQIKEVPQQLMATIRFSGSGGVKSHAKHQAELEKWLTNSEYQISGEPSYAGYDAPWVLPIMRRNEVMIPVTETSTIKKP